jgi:hypothetical protein
VEDNKKQFQIILTAKQKGGIRDYNLCDLKLEASGNYPRPALPHELSMPDINLRVRAIACRATGWLWSYQFINENSVCVEIGCDKGDGLERLKDTNAAKIIGVDPFIGADWDKWFDAPQDYMDMRYNMCKTRGERDVRVEVVRAKSDDWFAGLPAGFKADWWYVDGDHREEAVYNDLCNCLRHSNAGAHIFLDDVDCGDWAAQIVPAWLRFKANHADKIKVLWESTSPAAFEVL